jgi:hypothetical protein
MLFSFFKGNKYFNLLKFPVVIIETRGVINENLQDLQELIVESSTNNHQTIIDGSCIRRVLNKVQLLRYKNSLFYCQFPQAKSPEAFNKEYGTSSDIFFYHVFGFKADREAFIERIFEVIKTVHTKESLAIHTFSPDSNRPYRDICFKTTYLKYSAVKSLSRVYSPYKEEIFNLVKDFLEEGAEEYYSNLGVFYSEGALLYGPPGTGKTSMIISIAKELNVNLRFINLRSDIFTNDQLKDLFASPGIYVIEDVDPKFLGVQPTKINDMHFGFNYETLLNVLDGALATPGKFIFYTSNTPDALPPAMFRSGRVSNKYEIGYMEQKEFLQMWEVFFPLESIEAGKKVYSQINPHRKLTPADAQAHLQKMLRNK